MTGEAAKNRMNATARTKTPAAWCSCAVSLQVFGLKLVEIDSKNHIYILTNALEEVGDDEPPIR